MNVPLFFENSGAKNLKDSHGEPYTSYAEFRMDGPFIRRVTRNEIHWDVEINILVHAGISLRYSDEIETVLGIMAAAYEYSIPVYKYGDNVGDDQSQIGCLIIVTEKGEDIEVSRFGQVNPDTKLAQASIDGHYKMRQTL